MQQWVDPILLCTTDHRTMPCSAGLPSSKFMMSTSIVSPNKMEAVKILLSLFVSYFLSLLLCFFSFFFSFFFLPSFFFSFFLSFFLSFSLLAIPQISTKYCTTQNSAKSRLAVLSPQITKKIGSGNLKSATFAELCKYIGDIPDCSHYLPATHRSFAGLMIYRSFLSPNSTTQPWGAAIFGGTQLCSE